MISERNGFILRQRIISIDPKDAIEPHGYIFAFRGELVRIVFDDNAIRDVEISYLKSEK
jgi:hypothetical protein